MSLVAYTPIHQLIPLGISSSRSAPPPSSTSSGSTYELGRSGCPSVQGAPEEVVEVSEDTDWCDESRVAEGGWIQ